MGRVAAMAIGGWPVQTFCSQGVPSNSVIVGAYAMGSLLWIKVSRSKNALEPSPSRTLAAAGTARRLAAGSISENTRRAYAGAFGCFEEWLGDWRLNDPLLAAYLGRLFDTGASPAGAD